jgi:uncharacterized protein (DUF1684 family)
MKTIMGYLPNAKVILFVSAAIFSQNSFSQNAKSNYANAINDHVKKYVATHEVVKGEDRKHLHFFAPDSNYKVTATFEKIDDKAGFGMPTSQQTFQQFYRYGKISFVINGVSAGLTLYQSKALALNDEYKNYLFIPFTDATTGKTTYEGGRYIDISITDIKDNKVIIDFNKAYNPYCCYAAGYQCPVPPRENALTIAINAGEMKYTKPVH